MTADDKLQSAIRDAIGKLTAERATHSAESQAVIDREIASLVELENNRNANPILARELVEEYERAGR